MLYVVISLVLAWLLARRALEKRGKHYGQLWLSVVALLSGGAITIYGAILSRSIDGMDAIPYAVAAGLAFWLLALPAGVSLTASIIKYRQKQTRR